MAIIKRRGLFDIKSVCVRCIQRKKCIVGRGVCALKKWMICYVAEGHDNTTQRRWWINSSDQHYRWYSSYIIRIVGWLYVYLCVVLFAVRTRNDGVEYVEAMRCKGFDGTIVRINNARVWCKQEWRVMVWLCIYIYIYMCVNGADM